jgi:hypothetical protein
MNNTKVPSILTTKGLTNSHLRRTPKDGDNISISVILVRCRCLEGISDVSAAPSGKACVVSMYVGSYLVSIP